MCKTIKNSYYNKLTFNSLMSAYERASKNKIKKNIKVWNKLYRLNKLNITKLILSWNSFIAYLKHGNGYNFRLKMYYNLIYKDKKMKI